MERRRHHRHVLSRHIVVRLGTARIGAWTVDVSRSGIRLRVAGGVSPGDVLDVELPSGPGTLTTSARVCHTRPHSDGLLVGAAWVSAHVR